MSRHAGMRGVSADLADGDHYAATTRVEGRASRVELPSDRFTGSGRQTLTLEQWRRAHALAYPAADELEVPAP